jgi:hypothetical protein
MHHGGTRAGQPFGGVVPMRHQDTMCANCFGYLKVVQGITNQHDLIGLPVELLNPVMALCDFTFGIDIICPH